jgi:hypothetical protein
VPRNPFPAFPPLDPGAAILQGLIEVDQERAAQRARDAATAAAAVAKTQAENQAAQERQDAYLRQEAGKLISGGKCDEARKMALLYGDILLAGQITTACATR